MYSTGHMSMEAPAPLFSPEPQVRLVKAFADPFRNVVATARTCYSSKGIIGDEEIGPEWMPLARSIYTAGHHTTFQHAHFQFALANVSRQFIWSFLHAHPFYNSEQVSQRYVEVKPGSFLIPPLPGEARTIYETTVAAQMAAYRDLCKRLIPLVEAEYYQRFRPSKGREKVHNRNIRKKAQEAARYVLPVSTLAYLYHTISGITLLRYFRVSDQPDTPTEQKLVVGRMIEELLRFDPLYQEVLEAPLPFDDPPFHAAPADAKAFVAEFDRDLGGRTSKLISYKTGNEAMLAQAVREILGLTRDRLRDSEAIELVLNPERNPIHSESLNLTTLMKLTRAMAHPGYTFRKKLSHTADSQDQRHRMTPASRPVLSAHFTGEPDVITPELIRRDDGVRALYDGIHARAWEAIGRLRGLGVADEYAMYLLPNAVAVRFTESADLLNLHHKCAMRLCYNAQEEIWRAALDEALQVSEVDPHIGRYLLPPCTLRDLGGQKPICPEGERFCGIRVWKMDREDYARVI